MPLIIYYKRQDNMVKLIGREAERKTLDRFYHSPKAEFLAIYGRRRVGKTFLIQDFYAKKKDAVCFHSTGLKDGSLRDQIKSFTQVIGKTFYNGADLQNKTNWMDVFEQLTEAINKLPKNKKVILFFDEFPWMASKRSKLIQALDHYWNRYWSINPNIKLIVCGSAASWILEKLIHNKGGLYNRITYQIELSPFSLSESKKFLWEKGIKLSEEHVLKIYMVMGGIPLYLDHIEKGLSADQIIDSLCFTKRGLLFNEFDKLFQSLFENYDIHKELILLISENIYGTSQTELMHKSSKSVGGRLKRRLQDLEDTGFIESFIPYQHKGRGIYYRIVDEYILFYLKWIAPATNSIKRYDKEAGYWLSKSKSPSWKSWAGLAFEAICFKHISPIRKALHIPPGAEIGSWRYVPRKEKFQDQGAQIDLLFDREDGAVTICEIKYNEQPFSIDKEYAQKLLSKVNVYKQQTGTRKEIFIAMITKNGLKPSMYSEEIIHAVVTIKELFSDND